MNIDAKITQQNTHKLNPGTHQNKKIICHDQLGLGARMVQRTKIIQCNSPHKQTERKKNQSFH